MCRAGQWWICSCVELVNGGYAHVQSWSIVIILMFSGGQCWICSGAVVVYESMMDMLMCISGEWRICSCAVVVNHQ